MRKHYGTNVKPFFSASEDKVFWRPTFKWKQCPDDAKTIGHQTCRIKILVVNKTWKVEVHNTINQSWNRCHKMVSDHEVSSGSAIQPKKHNALWPCTIPGRSLQPKHGDPPVWMHLSTCPCFAVTWDLNLVGKQQQACWQHCKNKGKQDHKNCILMRPRSWWELEPSVFRDFNQSMTGNWWKCASWLKKFNRIKAKIAPQQFFSRLII